MIASGKMGVVYAVDRRSGDLAWKRPVGRHENDDLLRLQSLFDRGKASRLEERSTRDRLT